MRNRYDLIGKSWAIYARLSKDREGAGVGVQRQVNEVREMVLACDPDAQVVDVYVDNDISAYNVKARRPEYERMKADIQAGRINAVAAWHVDRLTRRSFQLESLVELAEETKAVFVCLHGLIDLSTPAGRMTARIHGAIAQGEVEHKAERQMSANRARALSGKGWSGGVRCYGYSPDGMTIIPEEAEILREIARRILPPKAETISSVIRDLQARDIRTPTGRFWSSKVVTRALRNPRLVGDRVYKGEVVARGVYPAIFDERTHQALIAFLADPERIARHTSSGPREHKYLLTGGISRCGVCGKRLVAQPSNNHKPGYICRKTAPYGGCGRIRIQGEAFEAHVASQVLARFASPTTRLRLVEAFEKGEDGEVIAQQIVALEDRLAQLGREYALGDMDKIGYTAGRNLLEDKIRSLRGEISQRERTVGLPPPMAPRALAEWWAAKDTTMQERRAVIMSVVDHVLVDPVTRIGYNKMDPERIRIIWK